MIGWPPRYQIRRSRRARYISLALIEANGVEIVLPLRATIDEGLYFLNSQRSWVEKQLALVSEKIREEKAFPTNVYLVSINKTWLIRYHHIQHSKRVVLHDMDKRLLFTGPIQEFMHCLPAFNQWLRRLAYDYLPQWLEQISQDIGLSFHRVSVRSQKTLWGSCSRQKNISLNDRLLFLPYELVRYVLIHELCHTVYFEHGKRFWQLVGRFDPHYRTNERSLSDTTTYIPSCFCR